ncbi:hypothetical protein Scep_016730 [Stephania cephalantha]|uniref:Uncharacterized protein n=1 Tax=Stephania cephalantha TaxID=152367 RepID=A0AAP0IQ53_9MAGN
MEENSFWRHFFDLPSHSSFSNVVSCFYPLVGINHYHLQQMLLQQFFHFCKPYFALEHEVHEEVMLEKLSPNLLSLQEKKF